MFSIPTQLWLKPLGGWEPLFISTVSLSREIWWLIHNCIIQESNGKTLNKQKAIFIIKFFIKKTGKKVVGLSNKKKYFFLRIFSLFVHKIFTSYKIWFQQLCKVIKKGLRRPFVIWLSNNPEADLTQEYEILKRI